jgi:hypothetical protein
MSTCTDKVMLPVGKSEMELHKDILLLRESNDIQHDAEALRERMKEDGYLFIRGLHDKKQVLETRRQMLEKLAENGALDANAPLMDGVINTSATSKFFGGTNQLTTRPAFQELVKSPRIMGFFEKFLGGPALTFDYKWLRVVSKGDFTGAHYDMVYMGRGTPNLYTCWTPIGDVPFELGPLALCVGSHRSEFAKLQQTYGKMDVDRDHVHGWFSDDPNEVVTKFGGKWHTAEFEAGDALVFGMYTMHMSLKHTGSRFRISSDTRYQLASEAVDERWIGEQPKAHYGWNDPQKNKTMEQARKEWGV